MKKKLKKCPECGKMKNADQVYERSCGYAEEMSDTDVREVTCDDCEHEHLMDI